MLNLLVILAYLTLNTFHTIKLRNNSILDKRPKNFHTIMIWLIPVVWFYTFKTLWEEEKSKTNTKKSRDQNKKRNNAEGFYESKKGWYFLD